MNAHFSSVDADAWFERNRGRLGARDPVTDLLQSMNLRPARVLEIGCSNGWRLAKLHARLGCIVSGIEPGIAAVNEARALGLYDVHIGTAASLPFADGAFDMVIFGFCLYLCEPADHLRIAAEADRVLSDGGHIVIHDFDDEVPFKRRYAHRDGVWSHHMNFARLWDVHPAYHICRRLQDEECVTVLRKNMAGAFPVKL